MEKFAQAGEVGGARPPPFAIFTITYKVAMYPPAEWADTLPLFHLYPYMYSVVSTLSAGAYTVTLYVMVDIVKRGGHAPPPHQAGMIFPS
jgi:hypothetical protein